MRGLTTALALAATVATSEAINLAKRSDAPPRVVQHDIQRKETTMNPVLRDSLRKKRSLSRRATITQTLDNEETLYFANVSMGTPEQTLRLHLDTGSSDLWVNVQDSTWCTSKENDCVGGYYSPNKSSTYEYVNSLFNISYVDGSGSAGDYATDVLHIGGATLEQLQFGIGYTSSSDEGIMGIGYRTNEAIVESSPTTYANVPAKMVQDGLISSNAYSLWLNDLDASTGSILFGGVNSDKYVGSLQTVPILKEGNIYAEFIIALTAVGMNGKTGSVANNIQTSALLDSGSSLMYLPDSIATDIFDATGAVYDERQGAAFIDCDAAYNDTTLDLTFSSPTISISMSELVIVAGYAGNMPLCILGIAPAGESTPVLGDTFLRSAYVVYDLNNNEISLAQTNFNSTSDNILEITNGSVPDATGVASAVSSVPSATGGGRIEGPTVSSSGGASFMTAAPMLGAGAMAALGFLAL
ncbi:hypothetical protein AAFC00_001287 [Neodothiora populina]|uniref:Peptidase A1 domain-containing protein n=1 Tax=Neodothiora populina TaxID=2781224 RepID=A0ABR3PNM8_9PEZI